MLSKKEQIRNLSYICSCKNLLIKYCCPFPVTFVVLEMLVCPSACEITVSFTSNSPSSILQILLPCAFYFRLCAPFYVSEYIYRLLSFNSKNRAYLNDIPCTITLPCLFVVTTSFCNNFHHILVFQEKTLQATPVVFR